MPVPVASIGCAILQNDSKSELKPRQKIVLCSSFSATPHHISLYAALVSVQQREQFIKANHTFYIQLFGWLIKMFVHIEI